MKKLEGKTAIITGANSGIGRDTAIRFAEEGARVIGIARRADKLDEVKNEIEKNGGCFVSCPGDITDDATAKKAVETAVEQFGTVDILVNCAGILDEVRIVGEVTNEMWDKVIAINLTAPMKMIREALPVMQKQKKGVIVNVGSTAGLNGCIGGAAYTSSKHGLVGLTKNVATTYVDDGIRCNAVCPHGVDTPMMDPKSMEGWSKAGMAATAKGSSRFIRLGQPDEMADIILFFASDDSRYINGVALAADAGLSAV